MKIDKKDRLILKELYIDARQSNSQIARKTMVSKESVAYRLKKLRQELIHKIVPVIDYFKIGYQIYKLQIDFNLGGEQKIEQIINKIKKIKGIYSINHLESNWDLEIVFVLKSNKEINEKYEEVLNLYGEFIKEKMFSLVTQKEYFNPFYLTDGKKVKKMISDDSEIKVLTEVELKILTSLLQDGRKSILDIAKEVNISPTNATYHLKKLIKEKIIIGYYLILNVEKINHETYNTGLMIKNNIKKLDIMQYLSRLENVTEITVSLGGYDLEFEMQIENLHQVHKILKKLKQTFKVNSIDTFYSNKEIMSYRFS
jgi:Lrp/AsnC family transcriptional regulator for asnA, asnC and gidA